MKKTYEKFTEEELILRDHLALDRTVLANERTFLSYIRTTLALVVVGATLIHLTRDRLYDSLGVLCIMSGMGILIVGIKRTLKMSERISSRKRK
jgi:putative membrane protein